MLTTLAQKEVDAPSMNIPLAGHRSMMRRRIAEAAAFKGSVRHSVFRVCCESPVHGSGVACQPGEVPETK